VTTSPGSADSSRSPGAGLRATGVSRAFRGVRALDGVALELRPHEVVGLIGPNGAGKTTLINLITGFDLADDGTISLDEQDVSRWGPARRARAGLARTFQQGRVFGELSVRENVELGALGVGARRAEARARAQELLDAMELTGRARAAAGELPHGEQRKIAVARALAARPRYVLMDEPAAGLFEHDVAAFAQMIRSVRDDYGAGVLIVDHNMALIMEVCDRIEVLDQGRTIARGTPEEVRRNLDVAAAYLGASGVRGEPSDA
jgi:branched-chain amino acid transport system ATP-binding protein